MTVRFLKSAAVIASLAVAPVAYAQNAAPTAAAAPADFYKMKLGSFTIVALSDGIFSLPTDQLLVERTPGEVKAILAAANAPTLEPTSVNAYLIDTGSRRILVDSGSGSYFGPTLGRAITALKAAGYKPEDIDEVLITHLHPDHVGGLSVGGARVFQRDDPHGAIGTRLLARQGQPHQGRCLGPIILRRGGRLARTL